jgi:hypothetical protein
MGESVLARATVPLGCSPLNKSARVSSPLWPSLSTTAIVNPTGRHSVASNASKARCNNAERSPCVIAS